MTDVIVSKGLRKSFGDFEAVRGVDLRIRRGECFGFLGPNGAGKTSVMRMIYCVSPLTGGELEVLGMDVQREPRVIKARLGVAPQDDNLDPDLTVKGNLTVYARYFGIVGSDAERRADELLEFMHLSEKSAVKVDDLSGGMKRRLIIARALINNPEILVLDEPTTGLDPQARHMIWSKVRELRSRGVTVLLTTHYMDEAEKLCDRLVIMDHGTVLTEGSPRDLIHSIVGRRVVEVDDHDGVVAGLIEREGWRHETVLDRMLVYTDDCDDVTAKLIDAGGSHVSSRDASLEDVFLVMTGRGLMD